MTVTIAPVAAPAVLPASSHETNAGGSGDPAASAAAKTTYAQVAERLAADVWALSQGKTGSGDQAPKSPQQEAATSAATGKSPAWQQRLPIGKDLPSTGHTSAAISGTLRQPVPPIVAAATQVPVATPTPTSTPVRLAAKPRHEAHQGAKKMTHTAPLVAPSATWSPPLPVPVSGSPVLSATSAAPANHSDATASTGGGAVTSGAPHPASPDPAHAVLLATAAAVATKNTDALPGKVTAAGPSAVAAPAATPAWSPMLPGAALPHAAAAAASGTVQAQIAVPADSAHFPQALAQHLVVLAGQQVQTARLHLSPPDMGPIAVEIRLHDAGRVDVALQVSHPLTHEVLRQSADTLQGVFQNQGLQLNLQLSGGQGQGQQAPTREEWLQLTQNGGTTPVDATMAQPLVAQIQALHRDTLLDTYA